MKRSRQRAIKYARAFFRIGGTNEQVSEREKDLSAIADFSVGSSEGRLLLSDPNLSVAKKLNVLDTFLKHPIELDVKRFVGLLLKRRLTGSLKMIAREYYEMVVYQLKELTIEISSAEKLSIEDKALIQSKLEGKFGKKCHLIEQINPTLLGGFTILVHDQLLDLSIKGMLTDLKKQLMRDKR